MTNSQDLKKLLIDNDVKKILEKIDIKLISGNYDVEKLCQFTIKVDINVDEDIDEAVWFETDIKLSEYDWEIKSREQAAYRTVTLTLTEIRS